MSLLEARSSHSSNPILQKALQGGKQPYNCGFLPVVKALSHRTQFLQTAVLKYCIQLAEALFHIFFPTEIQKMGKHWAASKRSSHILDTKKGAFCECNIYIHMKKTRNWSLSLIWIFSFRSVQPHPKFSIHTGQMKWVWKSCWPERELCWTLHTDKLGLFLENCPWW